MSKSTKYVYLFDNGKADGNAKLKSLLGGKGANLAEMSNIGLPVPPGFTVSTEACALYQQEGEASLDKMESQIKNAITQIEKSMGMRFGDPTHPLLLSVRSGAAVSMPGMMDTVLNLGLNMEVAEGLAKKSSNGRFAWDSYRRFIDMFGDVVMGVEHRYFEQEITALKKERGVEQDNELSTEDLKVLIERYLKVYQQHAGEDFPTEPWEQLMRSVKAVFNSWNAARAIKYRQINRITGLLGTAVNVQCMVFGNMGTTSATGVLFTRNPATGENKLYGEFLINAQGEDVVAGIRTPEPIEDLNQTQPKAYDEIVKICNLLEKHYQTIQDIEFTIQEEKLYILQTRTGKRTGAAALRIANEMVKEGLVDKARAITTLVEPEHLDQLLHPQFADPKSYQNDVICTGLPASPGAAVGQIVFTTEDAEHWKADGKKVILCRTETSPEDVGGMHSAEGILTSRGGMTSHAAVVARGWGKCCVAGCGDLNIDYKTKSIRVNGKSLYEGDWISLNGSTGEVILGAKGLSLPDLSGDFMSFMQWVDEQRNTLVRTNADSPEDAAKALQFGAEGIGLCRTEHMFFKEERILSFRKMVMATNLEEREKALEELLPFQRQDFSGIFKVMDGKPVTIRLLDPPLHEFLPHEQAEQEEMAKSLNISVKSVQERVANLSEANPMMGHRGCRLGIAYPEITRMQARAILEAAVEQKKAGGNVLPEIMVPLVGDLAEFKNQKQVIDQTAQEVFKSANLTVDYMVGTMIEIPRAALMADEIASEAQFFSFGTNDLTQMTFGFSRDDVGKFLPSYVEGKILEHDPFQVLDQKGVGQLIKLASERGRATRKDIKLGVCGEHGGEPSSVKFCCAVGLNYVSCSPFRIPIAKLAAAQYAIENSD